MRHVENSFLSKGYIVAFGPSYNQERGITPSGILCIVEVAYSYFGVFLWSIYQVNQKVATFKWGPEQGSLYNRSWLLCKLLCHLDYIIPYIQWCLK